MNNFILILFLSIQTINFTQDSLKFTFIKSIDINKSSIWEVDHFKNIYISTVKSFDKYDFKGKHLFSQSLKSLGNIKEIDVKNPLKIYLFSEEQQTISFLDNTLSIQNQINLNDFEVNYITHISSSNQIDKCWIFDQQNSQLKLLSNNKIDINLPNLSALFSIKNVYKISEKNNHIFIADSINGIYEFDVYGSLIQHYNVIKSISFDIQNQYLIVQNNNSLFFYPLNNFSEKTYKVVQLPTKDSDKVAIQLPYIYIESNNKIYVYQLNW